MVVALCRVGDDVAKVAFVSLFAQSQIDCATHSEASGFGEGAMVANTAKRAVECVEQIGVDLYAWHILEVNHLDASVNVHYTIL